MRISIQVIQLFFSLVAVGAAYYLWVWQGVSAQALVPLMIIGFVLFVASFTK